ncbi:hypothetical protein HKX48_000424 [Thoreauomyces humboldtii]|nr:hypothetical protein HKX48_000424 [Thoreauomyces humboldtii]
MEQDLTKLLDSADVAFQDEGVVTDWHHLGARARLFRALMEARYTISGEERTPCTSIFKRGRIRATAGLLDDVIATVEENMYPFIAAGPVFPSADTLLRSYRGKGIVMTTGNRHALYALHTVRVIRRLGCKLPIQLFYADDTDLAPSNRDMLSSAELGVELVDISTVLDVRAAWPAEAEKPFLGWAMKPFAMLASRYREIVFVDADALFLQDPAVMFEYPLYLNSGALLFRDRTLSPGGMELETFFRDVMEGQVPSKYYAEEGRVGRQLSLHEGESGVVVLDKHRNFHALLMACKMNSGIFKESMYDIVHGDKESYWIAQELLGLPYRWAPGGGGALGFQEPTDSSTVIKVCGQLFHPSPTFEPLWMNGGLQTNKYSSAGNDLLRFTHWATDREFHDVVWDWEESDRPFCLHRDVRDKGVEWDELSGRALKVLQEATDDWEYLEKSC